jgi:HSP90 family molecular chaperone
LNPKKLLKLVKKYSEFIDFPIFIKNKKEIEEEVPVEVE